MKYLAKSTLTFDLRTCSKKRTLMHNRKSRSFEDKETSAIVLVLPLTTVSGTQALNKFQSLSPFSFLPPLLTFFKLLVPVKKFNNE